MAQTVKNLSAMQEARVKSLGWEYPLGKGVATLSVFLPGEFHGQRSLAGYSSWGHKESDTTEQLSTALHNVILRNIIYRTNILYLSIIPGFPGVSDGKESACNVVDLGLIPGLRRSPGR